MPLFWIWIATREFVIGTRPNLKTLPKSTRLPSKTFVSIKKKFDPVLQLKVPHGKAQTMLVLNVEVRGKQKRN